MNTTILALEGLSAYRRFRRRRARAVEAAERAGREFLLVHRLFRSHRTGEIIKPSFMRASSPRAGTTTSCAPWTTSRWSVHPWPAAWGGDYPTPPVAPPRRPLDPPEHLHSGVGVLRYGGSGPAFALEHPSGATRPALVGGGEL